MSSKHTFLKFTAKLEQQNEISPVVTVICDVLGIWPFWTPQMKPCLRLH